MNKLMLLGGATLLALSGPAFAQAAPDAAPTADAPNDSNASNAPAPAPTDAAAPTGDAVAQTTAPAGDAPRATAGPATQAADAAAPAPTSAQTASAASPAAPSAEATAKVNADWAKYDEGNKGKLTPLEFGNWLMAAKGQDVTAQVEKSKTSKRSNLPAIKVLNATATDFSKADTDKDKSISPTELATYLSA